MYLRTPQGVIPYGVFEWLRHTEDGEIVTPKARRQCPATCKHNRGYTVVTLLKKVIRSTSG